MSRRDEEDPASVASIEVELKPAAQTPGSKATGRTTIFATSRSALRFNALGLANTVPPGMPFTGVSPGLMSKRIGLILDAATRVSSFECRGAAFNCLHSEIAYLPAGE